MMSPNGLDKFSNLFCLISFLFEVNFFQFEMSFYKKS